MNNDEKSNTDDKLVKSADKYCPDSVRESVYRELERRGYTPDEAKIMADEKYGDYW